MMRKTDLLWENKMQSRRGWGGGAGGKPEACCCLLKFKGRKGSKERKRVPEWKALLRSSMIRSKPWTLDSATGRSLTSQGSGGCGRWTGMGRELAGGERKLR